MTDPPLDRRPGPTHREEDLGGPAGRGDVSLLPRELADSYRVVRQMARVGGEATLFEVESRNGDRWMLKLYHPNIRLKLEALERVRSVDGAHVVELVDFGQVSDGRWYEVQEYIDGGNLVDFCRGLGGAPAEGALRDILAQVSEAIAALHAAGLAHHDIKPENVLVRSDAPLDVVLSDFGLTVVADSRTYYATNRNATVNYQAPETMRQIGGEPRDYWALGLTMAMLATGDVPYAGLNEHAILDQHHKRIPPPLVESLPDGRLKQLCRGLTRFDPSKRWSIEEIRDWLGGNNPAVATDSRRAADGLEFNQRTFTNPSELAAELVENWSLAAATIGISTRRGQFMDGMIRVFGNEALAELDGRWQDTPPRRDNVAVAVVEVALALDPDLDARANDRVHTPHTLAAAALSDSELDRQFVEHFRDTRVLEAWGRSPKHAELGEIDRRWRQELSRAYEIISRVQAADSRVVVPSLDDEWARLLLAGIAGPELLAEFQRQNRLDGPRGQFVPEWYQDVLPTTGRDSDVADIVAGVLLASEAERIQRLDAVEYREQRWSRQERRHGPVSRWVSGLAFVAAVVLLWLSDDLSAFWFQLDATSRGMLGGGMASAFLLFLYKRPHPIFGLIVALYLALMGVVMFVTPDDLWPEELMAYRIVYPQCALLAALFGQWKGAKERALSSGARRDGPRSATASRLRATVFGFVAAAAVGCLYMFGLPDYGVARWVLYVREGDTSGAFLGYSTIAYGLSAVSALWGSVLSIMARRSERRLLRSA